MFEVFKSAFRGDRISVPSDVVLGSEIVFTAGKYYPARPLRLVESETSGDLKVKLLDRDTEVVIPIYAGVPKRMAIEYIVEAGTTITLDSKALFWY